MKKKILLLSLVLFGISTMFSQENDSTFTDSRDGQIYRTISIAGQTWMAENLNYEIADGSWCYNDVKGCCRKYGRLYSWDAAMKSAPPGWHLPSKKEWQDLVKHIGGKKTAFDELCKGGSTEFEAILCGWRCSDKTYFYLGFYTDFWTSTQKFSYNAWSFYLDAHKQHSGFLDNDMRSGYSVRLVKDTE